jgi:hypothetical protein
MGESAKRVVWSYVVWSYTAIQRKRIRQAFNCAILHDRRGNVCAVCIMRLRQAPAKVAHVGVRIWGQTSYTFLGQGRIRLAQDAKPLGAGFVTNLLVYLLRFPPFPLRRCGVRRFPGWRTPSLLLAASIRSCAGRRTGGCYSSSSNRSPNSRSQTSSRGMKGRSVKLLASFSR